jgi:hypothetical protein
MTDPERLIHRWDCARSKILLRCSISRSPAVRALCESLTSGTMALTDPQYAEQYLRLLDLLEVEFGPLWPRVPNVN